MPKINLRRSLQFGLGFAGLAASLAVIGYLAYSWHTGQFAKRNVALFNTLMPMKEAQLESWLAERRADLSHYALSPAARQVLEGLVRGTPSPAAVGRAAAWFGAALRAHPEYERVDVLAVTGHTVWSSGKRQAPGTHFPLTPVPSEEKLAFSDMVLDGGRPFFTCLTRVGPLVVAIPTDVSLTLLPSLRGHRPLPAGSFDLYLARQKDGAVEVVDHDPQSQGHSKIYRLPGGSAVGRAFGSGGLAVGEDHFGKTIFAMSAATPWPGWRLIGALEVGAASSDSRWLALTFGSLGALAFAGGFLLLSRLMRSAEEEGESAQRRLALLTRLNETLRVCSTACRLAGSRKELAEEICRALSESGAFQFTTIWEPAPGDLLRPLACAGLRPGTSLPENVPARPSGAEEQSAVARAFNSQETVIVSDLASDERIPKYRAFGLAQGVRSVMAIPLSGACAGEVLVATSPQANFFMGEALSLLDAIAGNFVAASAAFKAAERSARIDAESATNRRLFEQSSQDYRRVLQAVECAAESIIISDEKGIIQYVNPACSRVTGYSREEILGRHTRTLKSGVHTQDFYQNLWRTISSGRVWSGRLVNKSKDGSFFEEEASIAPVKDEHGRITNYVAVKKDVTKELSLESQLQQSQKLEAVGRLAGGVAHDFNNILTAILGYTQLTLQGLPEGSPLREDLAEVEKGAHRAADLTRQLLIFSRKQVIKPQVLDPSQVALGLQKMLRRIVGENFHLRFVSDAAGVRILADPGQLEQVVLNFVVNARDAMPKGGDIEVAVRETVLAEDAPGVEGPIPAGNYAVISVRDTGTGIPPEVLPHIFDPFYTTKAAGEGTGLGLSTVYGIVKQGGAYLRVESAPGAGTVMSVFWPAAAPAPASEGSAAAPRPRGGAENILLVEDEPAILLLTERILKKAGYGVTAFPEAAPALAWARTAEARFDLLLTDVILPGGTGGKDLADALGALRPGLRVLFTSGYSADAVSHQGVLDAGTRLLPKPFSEETLMSAVRAALD